MTAKDRPFTMFAANLCFGQIGVDRLNADLCPMCGAKPLIFRDEKSHAEYNINGTCQNCQDRIFNTNSEEES